MTGFANWMLALGDGKLPTKKMFDSQDSNWIEIPSDFIVDPLLDGSSAIINSVYRDFEFLYDNIILKREGDCCSQK